MSDVLKNWKYTAKTSCLFYNSVISSVLVYAIPCWYDAHNKKIKN